LIEIGAAVSPIGIHRTGQVANSSPDSAFSMKGGASMSFANDVLGRRRPNSICQGIALPIRQPYFPSPVDWRDEILYFLLVDRFSDGQEDT